MEIIFIFIMINPRYQTLLMTYASKKVKDTNRDIYAVLYLIMTTATYIALITEEIVLKMKN